MEEVIVDTAHIQHRVSEEAGVYCRFVIVTV